MDWAHVQLQTLSTKRPENHLFPKQQMNLACCYPRGLQHCASAHRCRSLCYYFATISQKSDNDPNQALENAIHIQIRQQCQWVIQVCLCWASCINRRGDGLQRCPKSGQVKWFKLWNLLVDQWQMHLAENSISLINTSWNGNVCVCVCVCVCDILCKFYPQGKTWSWPLSSTASWPDSKWLEELQAWGPLSVGAAAKYCHLRRIPAELY